MFYTIMLVLTVLERDSSDRISCHRHPYGIQQFAINTKLFPISTIHAMTSALFSCFTH